MTLFIIEVKGSPKTQTFVYDVAGQFKYVKDESFMETCRAASDKNFLVNFTDTYFMRMPRDIVNAAHRAIENAHMRAFGKPQLSLDYEFATARRHDLDRISEAA